MNGIEGGDFEIFGKGSGHIYADTLGFWIKMKMASTGHAAFHSNEMAFA